MWRWVLCEIQGAAADVQNYLTQVNDSGLCRQQLETQQVIYRSSAASTRARLFLGRIVSVWTKKESLGEGEMDGLERRCAFIVVSRLILLSDSVNDSRY